MEVIKFKNQLDMNHSIKKFVCWALLLTLLVACEKDEGGDTSDFSSSASQNDFANIKAPSLDSYLTTTDSDGFSIRIRFNNGGDKTENMSCTVYWKAYASKPATAPKASSLTKAEPMRVYASTKVKTTFDKSHAGYNGGTYIYYYAKCSNSKYSCTTPVTFTIVKR